MPLDDSFNGKPNLAPILFGMAVDFYSPIFEMIRVQSVIVRILVLVGEGFRVDVDNNVAHIGANVVRSFCSDACSSKVEGDRSKERLIVVVVDNVDFTSLVKHRFHVCGFLPLEAPSAV